MLLFTTLSSKMSRHTMTTKPSLALFQKIFNAIWVTITVQYHSTAGINYKKLPTSYSSAQMPKGLSINDVTRFWSIFDPPSLLSHYHHKPQTHPNDVTKSPSPKKFFVKKMIFLHFKTYFSYIPCYFTLVTLFLA